MSSKAYLKSINLPAAPKPTLPVKTEEKFSKISLVAETQRRKGTEQSVRANPNAWTQDEEKKLKKLYQQGFSREEIANNFPARTISAVNSKIRVMRIRGQL